MSNILVAGNVNIETTLRVEKFPIEYSSVNHCSFGINSEVSGVSYNVARSLKTLGSQVRLAAMTATDTLSEVVIARLKSEGFDPTFLSQQLAQTPQAVVIYDPGGQRQTNTDLKNLQEQEYPVAWLEQALADCALFIPGNVNFARPWLAMAQARYIPIASDIQAPDSLDNPFNLDFMRVAHTLFLSNDNLHDTPENAVRQLLQKFGMEIIVMGLGAQGVLLSVKADNFLERIPSVYTRSVVNTSGAGDALFAAFNHFYQQTQDPYAAIKKAQVFASYKIGENGSSKGFLSEAELEKWQTKLK